LADRRSFRWLDLLWLGLLALSHARIWGGIPAPRLFLQDRLIEDTHTALLAFRSRVLVRVVLDGVWLLVLKRRWLILLFPAAVAVFVVLDWTQG
jgi:hypothetical protein